MSREGILQQMMVESALPLKHISLVELITTERTGALQKNSRKRLIIKN